MNPLEKIYTRPLWDTDEYWARQRARQGLRKMRAEFHGKRADVKRNRKNKLASKSRSRNRSRS